MKLSAVGTPTLIFPFKAGAVALVGKFAGNGWLSTTFADCPMFVMPGPYEARSSADLTIAALRLS